MSAIHRSRRLNLGFAVVLSLALIVPVLVQAEEQTLVAAPAAPTWDEASGYGSLEAIRAGASTLVVPATLTNQVPSDVRWAPPRAFAINLSSSRRGYIRSADVIAARVWDDTSGYGAVEAGRAAAAALSSLPVVATDTAAADCQQGTVIQTVTVPADGSVVQTSNLDRGQRYRLLASGFLIANRGTKLGVLAMDADHLFYVRDGALTEGADRLDGIDVGLAMTSGAGEDVPAPIWGPFDPRHAYARAIVGDGQPLSFRVQDLGTWDYVKGELTVEIACG